MRHAKHRHQLGVKTAHRAALMSNMAASLLIHGRIKTTLPKAKALRPFVEKVITLAKKAAAADDKSKALHFRRQALQKVRDPNALSMLFNERVDEFTNRDGGYTRIYKLVPRLGDAADMALIELISADDEGYTKRKKPSKKKKAAVQTNEAAAAEEADEVVTEEAAAEAVAEAEAESEVEVAEEITEEKAEATDEAAAEEDDVKKAE